MTGGKAVRVVNTIGLEQYLWGVVPSEMPDTWPAEALKSQAIVARTYALTHLQNGSGDFDVYPDTRSQVYGGISAESAPGRDAVNGTAGQVVLYKGELAQTFFFSSSGGRTANVQDVWGSKPTPYLVSVPDPYDTLSPYHDWGPLKMGALQLGKRLGSRGTLLDVRTAAGADGRVRSVTLVGSKGSRTLPGSTVRAALGLRSTWFTIGTLSLTPPRRHGRVRDAGPPRGPRPRDPARDARVAALRRRVEAARGAEVARRPGGGDARAEGDDRLPHLLGDRAQQRRAALGRALRAADRLERPDGRHRARQAGARGRRGAGAAAGQRGNLDDRRDDERHLRRRVRGVGRPAAGHLSRSRDRRPGFRGGALAGADRGVGVKRLLAVGALALTVAGTAAAAVTSTPNDPLLSRQWYLGRDHALDTFDAAKQLFTVRVGVIDSGVELGHPELKNRIVAHRSFVGGTVADTIGHGTFVAGEIAAIADNSVGIAGIAPSARLVVAKVTRDDGTIPPRAEARAIRWAVNEGVRVINLSLGSTRDPADPSVDGYSAVEKQAIEYAVRRGALVVAAAGNGNDAPAKPWPYASYPAAFPHVLGVGAYGRLGGVPSFSNRDDRFVDLSAPGMSMFSLFPRPLTATFATCLEQGYSSCGTQDYRHADGTSFAAPQVTAAAALLFGEEPSLRPDQVSEILKLTASDATPANGCADCSVGTGLAERLRPARRERCPRLAPGASADARPLRAQRRRRRPGRGRLPAAWPPPRRSTGGTTRTTSTGFT